MKSDEISQIANEYLHRQEALQQQTSELKAGKVGGLQTHKRHVAALEKAITSEREKIDRVYIVLYFLLLAFICWILKLSSWFFMEFRKPNLYILGISFKYLSSNIKILQ